MSVQLSTDTKIFTALQTRARRNKQEIMGLMAEGYYLLNPNEWVWDALGVHLDDNFQRRIMPKLFLGNKKRMVVRAGHSSGKTFISAILAHYFIMNYVPGIVCITGPTGKQTRQQVWSYIGRLHDQSIFKEELEWFRTKMVIRGMAELSFVMWVTSKNPKTIEGFHGPLEGKNLLWILEEAKGIADAVYEGLSGALSNEDNFLYVSSTCGRSSGFFYRAFHTERAIWEHEHAPSTDSPRVSVEMINNWKRQWGEESPVYRARVEAIFPSDDDMCIASLEMLELAIEPDSDDTDEFQESAY